MGLLDHFKKSESELKNESGKYYTLLEIEDLKRESIKEFAASFGFNQLFAPDEPPSALQKIIPWIGLILNVIIFIIVLKK